MSQPQSTNPTAPPAPPDGDPARSKRPRDDVDEPTSGDLPQATKRRVVLAQDVVFRIMLPSRQIGKVIGNKGSRIQKIREETRATIKIADAVSVLCSFRVRYWVLSFMFRFEFRVVFGNVSELFYVKLRVSGFGSCSLLGAKLFYVSFRVSGCGSELFYVMFRVSGCVFDWVL